MQHITALDNCAAHAPSRLAVALSLAHTHAVYLGQLAWPATLSCDLSCNALLNILDTCNLRTLRPATTKYI
jgi:hypothetical protein